MGIKLDRDDLTALLDDSARRLPPRVVDRLTTARQIALKHQARQDLRWLFIHQLAPVLSATARHHPLGWGLVLLFAAVVVAAFFQWHPLSPLHDHAALDLAILTDELPVVMYVD